MLLAIDIGNTNIVLGIFDGETLSESWRLATLRERTADELWVVVSQLLAGDGVRLDDIDGVIMSSVVPSLTETFVEMVGRGLGHDPLCVNAQNAGLPIRYENPDEVGADAGGFAAYLAGEGRWLHDQMRLETEKLGVFGVPSFVLNGEIFWGYDRMEVLRERLRGE